jgi:hypothetical protein
MMYHFFLVLLAIVSSTSLALNIFTLWIGLARE